MRRSRRRAHRRAWRGRGEARPDAGDVLGCRSGTAAASQMRVRRRGAFQSRQGVSNIVRLCRTRPYACEGRPRAVPEPSAFLMIAAQTEADVIDAVRTARAMDRTLEIVGAGTKRAYGRPIACDDVLDVSALRGIVKYEPA